MSEPARAQERRAADHRRKRPAARERTGAQANRKEQAMWKGGRGGWVGG